MKEPDEIDLLFQDELDGLTFTPDTYVKENIDHAIASKKKRRRFLFILFPVLFGLSALAATLSLYPSGKKIEPTKLLTSQNRLAEHKSNADRKASGKTSKSSASNTLPITTGAVSHSHLIQSDQPRLAALDSHSHSHSTSPNVLITKTTSKLILKSEPVSTAGKTPEHLLEQNKQEIPAITDPVKSTDRIPAEQEVLAANKPDTSTATVPDSDSLAISEVLKRAGSNKEAGKWSLSVLTYWEGEKRRASGFSDEPFIAFKRENAQVHASTFYGKVEINRQFAQRWEVLTGIGFRSSEIVQYGNLERIEIPIDGVSSGVPQPVPNSPDTIRWSEKQSFRVNSIVLPIGFACSIPIGNKLRTRLSAGAEFAYGHVSSKFTHPDLSAPKFRPFGCSVWLRPELVYSFGRTELFGFGTFNHTLSQQLRWKIDAPRNPAFGVGIGLRIRL
ncbi:hypothetical protein [Fluviicola sp.]|uniref:hypothetical protein n=1 Tax=Fluviicola sp. TaxID=1917219 RepID=UPI0031DB5A6C